MARFSQQNFNRGNPLATILGMLGQTGATNSSNAQRAGGAFQRLLDNKLMRKQQQMQQQQINNQKEMGYAQMGVQAALTVANPFLAAATAPAMPSLFDIANFNSSQKSINSVLDSRALESIPQFPGINLQDIAKGHRGNTINLSSLFGDF